MADEATQEPAADEAAETTQPEPAKGDGIPAEMKSALRKANKEAETLRLKLKEIEDRDKSELQRATERAEAAERAATEHESHALRLEVASEKGLTPAQAKRLVGSTRDELESDADEILRDFPPSNARPRGDAGQGFRGQAIPKGPADVFADFLKTQLPH